MASSGISGTYNEQSGVLTVRMRNGTYQLPGVPPQIAQGFLSAGSKGTYWNSFLKGRY